MLHLFKVVVESGRESRNILELFYNEERKAKEIFEALKKEYCDSEDIYISFEDVSNNFNQYNIDKIKSFIEDEKLGL